MVLIPPEGPPTTEAETLAVEALRSIAEQARGPLDQSGVIMMGCIGPGMLATVVPATPFLRHAALDLLTIAIRTLTTVAPGWSARGVSVSLSSNEGALERMERLRLLLCQATLPDALAITVDRPAEPEVELWRMWGGRPHHPYSGTIEEPTIDEIGQAGPWVCELDTVTQPAFYNLDQAEQSAVCIALAALGNRLDGKPRLVPLPREVLRDSDVWQHVVEILSDLNPPQGSLILTVAARDALAYAEGFEKIATWTRANSCCFGVHDLGRTEEDLQVLSVRNLDAVLLDRSVTEGGSRKDKAQLALVVAIKVLASQRGEPQVLQRASDTRDQSVLRRASPANLIEA